jgi:5-methylcytosine-specific restriction endonuclease McrA
MRRKTINAVRVWKDFEDRLSSELGLTVVDRAVYSHLLRHSRLEGVRRLRFSLGWLSRGTGLSRGPVRESVRRLIAEGALVLEERSCQAHHVVRVRLPHEVRGLRAAKKAARRPGERPDVDLSGLDFLSSRSLRLSIHRREGGYCFYCLRRIIRRCWCIDHVVPQAQGGDNSYRNLVSCCLNCNSVKTDRPAEEFLRGLYRDRRLSNGELGGRLRALDALTAGKLVPQIEHCRPSSR